MWLRLCVVVVAVARWASAAAPYNQVMALNELFHSTNGKWWDNSENWGVGDPCEEGWYGVFCAENGDMYVCVGHNTTMWHCS